MPFEGKLRYCILDIICYIKCSLFSVSGLICVAIILLFGIVLIDSYVLILCKINICFCNINNGLSLLKSDSKRSEYFTSVNNTQYTQQTLYDIVYTIE